MDKKKFNQISLCFVMCCAGVLLSSQAAGAEESRQDLSQKVQELEKKVDQLSEKWPSWLNTISFKGDFRYRHETIDSDTSDDRNRNRIRMRIGFEADVTEHATVGARFATGGDDPTSTNATLDGGFTTKDIKLDRAYVDLHPGFVPNLHIIGGKMGLPFITPGKSELMWDSDLSPEGGALNYKVSAGCFDLLANLGGFWVNEEKSSADSALFGGQGAIKANIAPAHHTYFLAGAGIFNYTDIAGNSTLHHEGSKTMGNSFTGSVYTYDYAPFEVFAEFGTSLKPLGVDMPFSIFGDYIVNTRTGCEDKEAYLAGVRLGKCKNPGSWAIHYNWREVQKDALLGVFTDSDFRGGGTDGRGHEIGLSIQVWHQIALATTYFNNETLISDHTAAGYQDDYHRFQIDLKLKF